MLAPMAAEAGARAAEVAPTPAALCSAGAAEVAPSPAAVGSAGAVDLSPMALLLPLAETAVSLLLLKDRDWVVFLATGAAAGTAGGACPVRCVVGANVAPAEGCWAREALCGGVTGTMRTCEQAALSAVQASVPCQQAVTRAATMQARQPSASSQPPGHDNEQVMSDAVQQASAQQRSCR